MPALAKRIPPRQWDTQLRHTRGHVNCPACDSVRRRMIEPASFANLKLPAAAEIWRASRERKLSDGSMRDYRDCIRRLTEFFSELTLREIHIGHFEEYQKARQMGAAPFKRKAGPSRINHELNTLSQILQRANLWAQIEPYYQPMKMPRPRVGRALSEDEERTLFTVASSKPRWKVAYLCSVLTANTTAGPGEIRMLRLMDVDLAGTPSAPFGLIYVQEGAKNEYRKRPIPLNRTAHAAARRLVERAQEIGAIQPDHFLLPHRADHPTKGRRGEFDPTRPMYSWRKAWDKLRVAASLPHLRMYDLRHHAITRLLENEDVSERTVMEIAGQVSKQTLARYSHIRLRSKLEGVLALERDLDIDPWDTVTDRRAKQDILDPPAAQAAFAKVLEKKPPAPAAAPAAAPVITVKLQ